MRVRSLAVGAGAALLLTACGGNPLDDKTGQEVTDAAADALEEAGAVRVAGVIGEGEEGGEVDLQLQGDDASGTITFGGAEVQLLQVGGTAYLQAPGDFWAQFGLPEEAAAQLEGAWVTVPDEASSEFEEFSLAGFVDSLRNPDGEVKEETKKEELDGDPVVVVEQEDGSTLTVSNDDDSHPLRLTNGEQEGELTFSNFGEEEDLEAPDDAVDLNELMGGS